MATTDDTQMVVTYEEILDLTQPIKERESVFGLPSEFKAPFDHRLRQLQIEMAKEIHCPSETVGLLPEDTLFFSSGVLRTYKELSDWLDGRLQQISHSHG